MKKLLIAFTLFLTSEVVFAAEGEHHHMSPDMVHMKEKNKHHDENKMPQKSHSMHHADLKGNPTPSAQAYVHANHTMHEGMNIRFSGNTDMDFLRGMIPHHQGAVDMAKIQLRYGQDGLLKGLTQKIIRDQKREIKIMKRLLNALENKQEPFSINNYSTQSFRRANHSMHKDMDIEYSGNADLDFVNGMIPHHRGAVDMAWIVIKHGKNSNVRNLAYGIVNAQASEIAWMKRWNHRQRLMRVIR